MANNTRQRDCRPQALILIALVVGTMPVTAQDENAGATSESTSTSEPDTSEWLCENCPYTYGLSGSIELGAGYVSEDFFEFGNFRGLEDEGLFGAFGADLLYRDDSARYFRLHGERLGLDSRSLLAEGGRQGSYELSLEYDEIAHFRAEDTRTIFLGAGTANQNLPTDWIKDDNTSEMTQIEDSLTDINIGQDRELLRLGFAIENDSPWSYAVDLQRTTREGNAFKGASMLFRSAQLAAPIDYETTQVDAAVSYIQDTWQLEVAYNLSIFDNDNRSLRWQNPFTAINGADQGQLAEPPDNQAHQVMLSGSWRLPGWLTVAGQFALGRIDQDDAFLAPTINSNLTEPSLPRNNLDGEINTRIANLRITGQITNRLSAKAQINYDERDNDTPRDSFLQVATDAFVTGARTNLPFSHERFSAKGILDYRLLSSLKLSASVEHREMERSFQEVEDTNTERYGFQARARPIADLGIRVEFNHEERDNDLDPNLLGMDVNPDLRRFHFAQKNRDALRVDVDYSILQNLMAGAFFELADEEFSDTKIGLSDAHDVRYGLDISSRPTKNMTAHAFFSIESLEADIFGRDSPEGTPWQFEQDDNFRTVGFGMEFMDLPGKWGRAGVDFTYASADGELRVIKRGSAPPFPELQTRRCTAEAFMERSVRANMDLRLGYLVGKLRENDFLRDHVYPATISNVLTLGEQTPDGTVHVITALLRYHFE